MIKDWVKIISLTGAVGVVGLLFSLFMNHLFGQEILNLLGSEKIFYILNFIIFGLFLALIIAMLKSKSNSKDDDQKGTSEFKKDIKITYDNKSTHNGDNNF